MEANGTLTTIDQPEATAGEWIDQAVKKLRRARVMGLHRGEESWVDDLALLLRVPPSGPNSQILVAVPLLGNEPQMYIQLVVELRQARRRRKLIDKAHVPELGWKKMVNSPFHACFGIGNDGQFIWQRDSVQIEHLNLS